ncbi:uncharacterized protein LOC133193061 [Saccostrea echinata]|uniref:uncharacterized protein LOC133193061 n=1 Tax=Saccostrea echinata TaxID=191078 RepID=UPI002A80CD06|nr:uncharacterized protein LOC133193061 [Saccostrea echinata]
MARRSGVREDKHFLVKYLCDDNFQVRSRAYFKCDSDIVISVGEEYDVQWGRPKEVDLAVVLGTGSEQELRVRMREMESLTEPSSPSPPPSPLSPSPPASPAPKRRKIPKTLEKSGKPRATVIADGSPPDVSVTAQPTVSSHDALATQTEPKETPTTSTGTPSTPTESLLHHPTPVRFRAYRQSTGEESVHSALMCMMKKMSDMQQTIDILNKKVDASNRRSAAYEATLKTLLGNTNILIDIGRNSERERPQETPTVTSEPTGDDNLHVSDIPEEYKFEDSELRQIVRDSRNAGNFAVNLSRRLLPELYGEGNLRFQYNWYGGGKHNKKELDPVRKTVVRKYVCFFYPEVASDDAWRERIVSRVNESLRRNDKRCKKVNALSDISVCDISISPLEPTCDDAVFTFTE